MIYYAVVIAGAYQLTRWLFALVDIVEGVKRKEERRQLEARNCQHEKPLKSEEEIEDIFDDAARDPGGFEWRYVTLSEFKEEYSSLHRYDVSQIGKVLDKFGILTERPRINGKKTRVRRLPCHKWGRMEIPVTTQKTDVLLS